MSPHQLLKKNLGPLTFGNHLQAIRICDGYTQVGLCKKLHISVYRLKKIEQDLKLVDAKTAARFAKILGYSQELFISLAFEAELRRAGLKKQKVRKKN